MPTSSFNVGDWVYFQVPGKGKRGYGQVQETSIYDGREYVEVIVYASTEKQSIPKKYCLPAPSPKSRSITPPNAPRVEIRLIS